MQAQEVAIKPNLRVVLKSDTEVLDEVVVTAMGIKRSEKALGYSATSVNGDKITATRNSDVMSALSGKLRVYRYQVTHRIQVRLILLSYVVLVLCQVPISRFILLMEYR